MNLSNLLIYNYITHKNHFPTYFYCEFWDIRIPEIFFVIEFIMAANQPCDINQQVI